MHTWHSNIMVGSFLWKVNIEGHFRRTKIIIKCYFHLLAFNERWEITETNAFNGQIMLKIGIGNIKRFTQIKCKKIIKTHQRVIHRQ